VTDDATTQPILMQQPLTEMGRLLARVEVLCNGLQSLSSEMQQIKARVRMFEREVR